MVYFVGCGKGVGCEERIQRRDETAVAIGTSTAANIHLEYLLTLPKTAFRTQNQGVAARLLPGTTSPRPDPDTTYIILLTGRHFSCNVTGREALVSKTTSRSLLSRFHDLRWERVWISFPKSLSEVGIWCYCQERTVFSSAFDLRLPSWVFSKVLPKYARLWNLKLRMVNMTFVSQWRVTVCWVFR